MRWSGWPVHQLSTHGSRCRKCGGAPHGWCGSSSCEEDRNPQPTFLGLNLNLKMVWRAVKLATGCFHFFHQSSGSPGVLGVSGVPESQTVNCTFAKETCLSIVFAKCKDFISCVSKSWVWCYLYFILKIPGTLNLQCLKRKLIL